MAVYDCLDKKKKKKKKIGIVQKYEYYLKVSRTSTFVRGQCRTMSLVMNRINHKTI